MDIMFPPSDIQDFLAANDSLPLRSDSGVHIQVIRRIDGLLRIAMVLNENTSDEDLRKANGLALEWNKRLKEYQGIYFGGTSLFLEMRLSQHEGGKTFSEIAEDLNNKLESFTRKYASFKNQSEESGLSFARKEDQIKWAAEHQLNSDGLVQAHKLLRQIRVNRNDLDGKSIDEFLQDAVNEICQGGSPISKSYPITPSRVQATLKSWKHGKKRMQFLEGVERFRRGEDWRNKSP